MIDKEKIKTMTQIQILEDEGVQKDVSDTMIRRTDYILKKIFFRTTFVFLISFVFVALKRLVPVYFIRDYINKENIYSLFSSSIFIAFIISLIYGIMIGVYFNKVYSEKERNVRKYYKLKSM